MTGMTGSYTESYSYSAIGNITNKNGSSYAYTDTAHAHAVTSIGGEQRYWYDPNGNMTVRVEISGGQRITYTQGWDIDNRLVAVTSTLGYTTTFAYDADGQRVARSDISGTTAYIGQYYELQLSSGITTSYYTFGSQRVAMRTGSSVYWLHGDHLGSASLTTDANGAVVSEMRYYPFGEVRYQSGTMPTDHTFTGQRADGSLMDYGARFYSPILGRFISADSIVPQPGDPQSLNRYSYVRNSPLVRIDPSGHTDCDAGNTQCWIDQYVAKANWYRQNLAFRWLANNHLEEDTKKNVETFYRNLLDDPDAFMKRFLDVATFGRSYESTYLMLLTTETTLDYRSPEQLVSAIVEDTKGSSAANAVLYAHQRNQNDPSSDFNIVSLVGVAAPGFGFAIIVVGSNGTLIPIPEGWSADVARNGAGMVYQRPGAVGNADSIRVMDPTVRYPEGYVVYYNWKGQPLDVNGSQGNPAGRDATHIPLTYEGPLEKWPK